MITLVYTTQIRRPIGTVFELILPALAVIVIIGLRYGMLLLHHIFFFFVFQDYRKMHHLYLVLCV